MGCRSARYRRRGVRETANAATGAKETFGPNRLLQLVGEGGIGGLLRVLRGLRVLATEVARIVRVALAVVDGDLWMGTERTCHLHGSVAYA
jgi:hypothetical protein